MKVTLIDYTGKGNPDPDYAMNLLIFTKQTRLQMSPGLLEDIGTWPIDEKLKELEYMANTIPSSWEFIHLTFMVEQVTRSFTHQFVRSRQFSFAQQTMRVLNVKGWDYYTGPTIDNETNLRGLYNMTMVDIADTYDALIKGGAAIEDARGVLPTNILTNIVGSCNMRTFVELVRKRSSPRTQEEYRAVLDAMKTAVRKVWPWIDYFIDRTFERAASDLDQQIKVLPVEQEIKTHMIKLVDQMRSQS